MIKLLNIYVYMYTYIYIYVYIYKTVEIIWTCYVTCLKGIRTISSA